MSVAVLSSALFSCALFHTPSIVNRFYTSALGCHLSRNNHISLANKLCELATIQLEVVLAEHLVRTEESSQFLPLSEWPSLAAWQGLQTSNVVVQDRGVSWCSAAGCRCCVCLLTAPCSEVILPVSNLNS